MASKPRLRKELWLLLVATLCIGFTVVLTTFWLRQSDLLFRPLQSLTIVLNATASSFHKSPKATTVTSVADNLTQKPSRHTWHIYGSPMMDSNDQSHEEIMKVSIFNKETESRSKRLLDSFHGSLHCSPRSGAYQNSMSEKYGKFLESLSNYAEFHTQNRNKADIGKLVWYCGNDICGGLADRVKGVTYTLMLAMMSNRVLLFDWHDSRIDKKNYVEPNVIDWRLTERERKRVFDDKNHVKPGQHADTSSVLFVRNLAKAIKGEGVISGISDTEERAGFDSIKNGQSWVALQTNILQSTLAYSKVPKSIGWIKEGLEGMGLSSLNQYDMDRLSGLGFRYLLKLSSEILQEIDNARQILGLNNQKYIALHVRTGFVGSKFKQEGTHSKLVKDQRVWENLIDCAHNQSAQLGGTAIFLATDSNKVKDLALRKYGNVRSLNNSVIHVDRLKLSPDKIGDAEREGVMSVWVDMALLAEAHTMVMGKSGYPFLAASICLIPQHRILNGINCQTLGILETVH